MTVHPAGVLALALTAAIPSCDELRLWHHDASPQPADILELDVTGTTARAKVLDCKQRVVSVDTSPAGHTPGAHGAWLERVRPVFAGAASFSLRRNEDDPLRALVHWQVGDQAGYEVWTVDGDGVTHESTSPGRMAPQLVEALALFPRCN